MLAFVVRAALSGVIVALVASIARRSPAAGALIASLPLVSVLGMIWLWRDKPDAATMAAHAGATVWYVLPSLPMFPLIAALLRHGVGVWPALLAGGALTIVLYALTGWLGTRCGLPLCPEQVRRRRPARRRPSWRRRRAGGRPRRACGFPPSRSSPATRRAGRGPAG